MIERPSAVAPIFGWNRHLSFNQEPLAWRIAIVSAGKQFQEAREQLLKVGFGFKRSRLHWDQCLRIRQDKYAHRFPLKFSNQILAAGYSPIRLPFSITS